MYGITLHMALHASLSICSNKLMAIKSVLKSFNCLPSSSVFPNQEGKIRCESVCILIGITILTFEIKYLQEQHLHQNQNIFILKTTETHSPSVRIVSNSSVKQKVEREC